MDENINLYKKDLLLQNRTATGGRRYRQKNSNKINPLIHTLR